MEYRVSEKIKIMENNNNQLESVLSELSKFTDNVLHLGNPIIDDRLDDFEKKIGFLLPNDFKYILKKYNGFSLFGTVVYGIDSKLLDSSLDKVYQFEHYEVANKMLPEFLPFSPDGRGNHYCLDLTRINHDTCPVIFWQWDYDYNDLTKIETCNINFLEWVQEVVIDWALEDYNYDGSEK